MVKIELACPDCGGKEFNRSEDGSFKCASCGTLSYPENMCSEAAEINFPITVECDKTDCQSYIEGRCMWKVEETLISLAYNEKYDMCERLREKIIDLCNENPELREIKTECCYHCEHCECSGLSGNATCNKHNRSLVWMHRLPLLFLRKCSDFEKKD